MNELQQENKKLYRYLWSLEVEKQKIKRQIETNKEKMIELCGIHDWIIDFVEYDGTRMKCGKDCGATK